MSSGGRASVPRPSPKALGQLIELLPGLSQPLSRILPVEPLLQRLQLGLMAADRPPDDSGHPLGIVGQPHLVAAQDSARIGKPHRQPVESGAAGKNLALEGFAQSPFGRPQRELQVREHGRQLLGGGAWSGSAKIRDKVGNGEVHLVPNRGDDRLGTSGDRSGDDLLIEGPQILHRASTSGEDNDIDVGASQTADRPHHLPGGAIALDPCVAHQHREPGVTAMQDAKKIAKRGATDAGHHADPARQKRNRPRRALPVLAQQPFLRQPLLELLKSQREGALSRRLDALNDQAVATARLVDVDASFHQNRESIAQFELHSLRDGRPHLGFDAGVLILEVEVQMPARISASKTRHFALNPDSRIFVLQQILDLPGQLAHGEHHPGSGFPTLDRRTLLRNGRQRRWNGWRRWVGRLLGRRGRPKILGSGVLRAGGKAKKAVLNRGWLVLAHRSMLIDYPAASPKTNAKTIGPKRTRKTVVKMQPISGRSILTGAWLASFSARWLRSRRSRAD